MDEAPQTEPSKLPNIRYLYIRAGFGATPTELAGAGRKPLWAVVKQLLTGSSTPIRCVRMH